MLRRPLGLSPQLQGLFLCLQCSIIRPNKKGVIVVNKTFGILGACALTFAVWGSGVEAGGSRAALTDDAANYSVPGTIPSFSDFLLVETQMGEVTPKIVSMDEAAADLAQYDVVFFGESHGHAANHLAQVQMFQRLYARNPNLTLSMEQFERSAQDIMDQYLAGEIGEQVLRDQGNAWEHYTSSYRPLVEFAKTKGLPVIASEVPGNMVSCVGEEGPAFLDRLSGEPRGWIADTLNLQDGPYKERYLTFLSQAAGHGAGGAGVSEAEIARINDLRFAAQVSRDDTMAESIALHLQENPGRQVMHINGSFHSAALLGTVERLVMRMPEVKVANIHPVIVEDGEAPSFGADMLGEGQYLLLIQPVPKRFVKMENINAFVAKTRQAIDENRCAY